MTDWTPYLNSIRDAYARWWQVYTFTDVVGETPQEASQVPLLDLGLMVETRVPQEKSELDEKQSDAEEEKQIERLGVLEGLRKYAAEHVLLVGRPGSGKSTALLRMLLEEVEGVEHPDGPLAPNSGGTRESSDTWLLKTSKNSDSKSRSPRIGGRGASSSGEASEISQTQRNLKIPILVELRYWQTSTLDLIRRFLLRHGIALSTGEIEAELAQGRFLLLIDGINELPSEAARRNVKAFRQDYPRSPMVFTTRELGLGGDLEIGQRLEMQPLSDEQMRQFVLRYLPEQGEEMWGQMGDRLRQLGETPLLLWMLCSVFAGRGNIPNSLGLVFRRFTALYGQKLKEDVAAESRRWWTVMLRQLAWEMTEGDEPTEILVAIPRARAEAALVACLRDKVAFPEARAKEWLEELLQHHLIQLRADAQIEFRHQLIQEYYAAEKLLERVPEMADEVLQRRYLNYLKWTEPVALMLELVTDEVLAVRVVERALDVDLRLGARLAGAVQSQFQRRTVGLIDRLKVAARVRYSLHGKTKADAAVAGLLEALQDKGSDVRVEAANALGKIQSDMAVPGLLEALKDRNSDVRGKAANALGKIQSDMAVSGLLEALKDKDSDVCGEVVDALGRIQSEVAVPGLLEALKYEGFFFSQTRVTDALVAIQSDVVVIGLLEAFKEEDNSIRASAVDALCKIQSDVALAGLLKIIKDEEPDNYLISAADILVEFQPSAAVRVLIEAIKDKYPNACRRSAAYNLGRIKSNAAVPGLLNALKDDNSAVRSSAADALGRIKSDVAVPGLIEALKDENSAVRSSAAAALCKIQSDVAVPGLLDAIKDKDSQVRCWAAAALGEIKSDVAVLELLDAIKDEDSAVRSRAADALCKIQSDVAVPGLLDAIKDKDSQVRYCAANILGRIKSDVAVSALTKALKDKNFEVRRSAADALGRIQSDAAVPGLIEALKDEDFEVRSNAAAALGKIQSDAAVPMLLYLINNNNSIRLEAIYALAAIKPNAAVPWLLKEFRDNNSFWPPYEEVAYALGKIKSDVAVAGLLKVLEDKDFGYRVRSSVADALGEVQSDVAVAGLTEALKDEDSKVRRHAAEALVKIQSGSAF